MAFALLGRTAYRWRWAILVVWGVALLLAVPLLPRVPETLKVGGVSSPRTEVAHARGMLQRELGFPPSTWNWWLPSPLRRLLPARPLLEESA